VGAGENTGTTKQHEITRTKKETDLPQSNVSNLSKNQLARLRSRIKEIEQQIPALEEKAAQLTIQMAEPQIASDFGRLKEVTQKHAETEKQIQALYAEWETVSEQLG
jgi:ATP-binding cassette subfamily F protein 3